MQLATALRKSKENPLRCLWRASWITKLFFFNGYSSSYSLDAEAWMFSSQAVPGGHSPELQEQLPCISCCGAPHLIPDMMNVFLQVFWGRYCRNAAWWIRSSGKPRDQAARQEEGAYKQSRVARRLLKEAVDPCVDEKNRNEGDMCKGCKILGGERRQGEACRYHSYPAPWRH